MKSREQIKNKSTRKSFQEIHSPKMNIKLSNKTCILSKNKLSISPRKKVSSNNTSLKEKMNNFTLIFNIYIIEKFHLYLQIINRQHYGLRYLHEQKTGGYNINENEINLFIFLLENIWNIKLSSFDIIVNL